MKDTGKKPYAPPFVHSFRPPEHEDVVEILVERRSMINSEFEVYIKSMWRAKELSKYFKEELAYFRDSYAISEKLVGNLI